MSNSTRSPPPHNSMARGSINLVSEPLEPALEASSEHNSSNHGSRDESTENPPILDANGRIQVREEMAGSESLLPQIALIGAGYFAQTTYIPTLRELADSVIVKTIWSLDEESAKAAAELACDFSPNVEFKWGDSGLDEITQDSSIQGVALVLAAQVQVDISLKMLRAGKHVIQEKPASGSITEAETALSSYKSLCTSIPHQPIWAVAENFRFEPAFVESRKLLNDIGDMMNILVVVEGYLSSSNPYFPSSWRRKLTGGFVLDMAVHFIAALRMLVGCGISTVSAIARHVHTTLPPPDNVCALFQMENGCAAVYAMAVSSISPKVYWRVDGTKGALHVERFLDNGKLSYEVLFYSADGSCQRTVYPFCGVKEELKSFVHDIAQASSKEVEDGKKADPRSLYAEGAQDVAIVEAMLESSAKNGATVHVKKF